MRILVNTRVLIKDKLEGIGWFAHETLKRIVHQHPEHEFIFVFDRKWDESFIYASNVKPIKIPFQSRHPILWDIHFNYLIPYLIRKYKADFFLSPDGWFPLRCPVKGLTVIHDINFHHFPELLPKIHSQYLNKRFPCFAQEATRIATVSEFSKNDISSTYMIDPSKIDLVFNGYNTFYHPVSEDEKVEFRKMKTSGLPYFLFIGALNPRKNIIKMLEAFDLFKKKSESNIQFVLVGEKSYWTKEFDLRFNQLKYRSEIHFWGRQAPEQLNLITNSALCMVFVPIFEGFGIPILEAFRCRIPLITSNSTAIPEVAQDAALYVNPFHIDEICKAMLEMSTNENLRADLVLKGDEALKKFSWDKTAQLLWKSMEKAM